MSDDHTCECCGATTESPGTVICGNCTREAMRKRIWALRNGYQGLQTVVQNLVCRQTGLDSTMVVGHVRRNNDALTAVCKALAAEQGVEWEEEP